MNLLVHFDSRGTAENRRICIVHRRRGRVANLKEEFPIVGEFNRLPIFGAISGNPDVARLLDENTMLGTRPVIALTWAAPRFDQVALSVKFQYRRRRSAANGNLLVQDLVILYV